MRRLRVTVRLLAAVLLALSVRVVVSGINVVIGLTGVVVACACSSSPYSSRDRDDASSRPLTVSAVVDAPLGSS